MDSIKECSKCRGRMIDDRIIYKTTILGQEVIIPDIMGYKCTKCGNTEINQTYAGSLKDKLVSKRLEILLKIDSVPIMISNLKSIRENNKVSQKMIGKVLQFTEQRYGAVERNDNTPTIYLSLQIADVLDVDINKIYRLEYVPKKAYNEIRCLNEDYDVIENLPELWEEYERTDDEYKKINKKIRKVQLSIERGQATAEELNLLLKQKEELKEKKDRLLDNIKDLSKECIMKQGCCLDEHQWRKVQDKYGNMLKATI